MQPGKQLHLSEGKEPLFREQFVNAQNCEETAFMKKRVFG
jgi:hypothetical protein